MHPFESYHLNKLLRVGNKYLLRVSNDVMWETSIDQEGETSKFVCKIYEEPHVFTHRLSTKDIQAFMETIIEAKLITEKEDQIVAKIKFPLKGAKVVNFKKSEAAVVFQHEFAITYSDAERPILGTFGAGTCLILALYDASSKIAVLAHIDHKTDLDSLPHLFTELTKENTVAHLFGGTSNSKDMCIKVINLLEENKITIVNSDIVREGFDGASLAIDARNGDIFSPVSPFELDITMSRKGFGLFADFEIEKTPLSKCYDGRKLTGPTSHLLPILKRSHQGIQENNFQLPPLLNLDDETTDDPEEEVNEIITTKRLRPGDVGNDGGVDGEKTEKIDVTPLPKINKPSI